MANAAHLHVVTHEDLHFSHMLKTLARLDHFNKTLEWVWGNKISLTLPLFIEVPVPRQESE